MPLKSEIHEPAASFYPTAGDDDLHGGAIFDIPKIIIILIYFGKFSADWGIEATAAPISRSACVEEGWAWNDELLRIPKKKR
ncbi:MAG: hypothetical protein HZC50_11640 [Nitrospirae bacterium]|nr:hypothetical protein [Nitrospirota bacterium]